MPYTKKKGNIKKKKTNVLSEIGKSVLSPGYMARKIYKGLKESHDVSGDSKRKVYKKGGKIRNMFTRQHD